MFYQYVTSFNTFFIDERELKVLQDYEKLHRIYWGIISDKKLLYKPIIRSIKTSEEIIRNDCFACAYAFNLWSGIMGEPLCSYCPIKQYRYKSKPICPCCREGLYNKWTKSYDPEIAKQISELEFTEPKHNRRYKNEN